MLIKHLLLLASVSHSVLLFSQKNDSLLFLDGKKIETVEQWESKKPIIKSQFLSLVYGEMPPPPLQKHTINKSIYIDSINVLYQEILIDLYKQDQFVTQIRLSVFLPDTTKPNPIILALNKCGNLTVIENNFITAYDDRLLHNYCEKKSSALRGLKHDFWQLDSLFKRGYGFATFHESDISPDIKNTREGVFKHYPELDNKNGWGLISAWAWGLHRTIDYLHTNKLVDTNKLILFGHSRRGKTALLATALDERVDAVVPHQSGTVGMALSKSKTMESVKRINKTFPHWFSDQFKEFAKNPKSLPIDQHYLVALVGPRPVLETVGSRDYWSSYWVSHKTLLKASPVYELYGEEGVIDKGKIKYKYQLEDQKEANLLQIRRPYGHTMNGDYWSFILDFLDYKLRD